MADPVGLAASIVGLIAVASKVSKLCYDYCNEARSARGDIVQLVSAGFSTVPALLVFLILVSIIVIIIIV